MRKRMVLLLSVLLVLSMTGCGKKKQEDAKTNEIISDNSLADQENNADNSQEKPEGTGNDSADSGSISQNDPDYQMIDVDLSVLPPTLAYSQLFNMMEDPEDYENKIVKVKGSFLLCGDEGKDAKYCYCVVKDATACCAVSLEFNLLERYVYPDDYPADYEEIILIGRFCVIHEDEYYFYCVLNDAMII